MKTRYFGEQILHFDQSLGSHEHSFIFLITFSLLHFLFSVFGHWQDFFIKTNQCRLSTPDHRLCLMLRFSEPWKGKSSVPASQSMYFVYTFYCSYHVGHRWSGIVRAYSSSLKPPVMLTDSSSPIISNMLKSEWLHQCRFSGICSSKRHCSPWS